MTRVKVINIFSYNIFLFLVISYCCNGQQTIINSQTQEHLFHLLKLIFYSFQWGKCLTIQVTGKDNQFEKFDCWKDEQSIQREHWFFVWSFRVSRSMCGCGKGFIRTFYFWYRMHITFLHRNIYVIYQELDKLLGILRLAHELLSKDLSLDPFTLMLNEMQENISLVSYSSRLASQVCIFLISLYLIISRVCVQACVCKYFNGSMLQVMWNSIGYFKTDRLAVRKSWQLFLVEN